MVIRNPCCSVSSKPFISALTLPNKAITCDSSAVFLRFFYPWSCLYPFQEKPKHVRFRVTFHSELRVWPKSMYTRITIPLYKEKRALTTVESTIHSVLAGPNGEQYGTSKSQFTPVNAHCGHWDTSRATLHDSSQTKMFTSSYHIRSLPFNMRK